MIGIQARLMRAKLAAGEKLHGFARRFARDESGATAIEYGLIAAGIAIAIIAVVFALGGQLQNMFQDVNQNLQNRPGS